jgi:uncharacterized protein (TIGR02594 family)
MAVFRHVLPVRDPAWLKGAFRDEGLKELPGKKHAARILKMFRAVGHPEVKDDETAWCAAAVGTWLSESGQPHTSALNARSYLQWGKPTDNPTRGDVVIFKRGNSTWQGHVALFLGQEGGRVWVIGGNQSNAVTVDSYPASSVLGYRTPVTVRNSRTVKAAAVAGVGTATASVGGVAQQVSDTANKAAAFPHADMAQQVTEAGSVLQGLASVSIWLMAAGGLVTVGGIGWVLFARYVDWKEKAR